MNQYNIHKPNELKIDTQNLFKIITLSFIILFVPSLMLCIFAYPENNFGMYLGINFAICSLLFSFSLIVYFIFNDLYSNHINTEEIEEKSLVQFNKDIKYNNVEKVVICNGIMFKNIIVKTKNKKDFYQLNYSLNELKGLLQYGNIKICKTIK